MSSARESSVPDAWGPKPNFFFGNREAFKDMAADDAFPRWLRVTFAAYGHVRRNGHATFRQGRLAWILGEHEDGLARPTTRQRVREAIDGAVERGLLCPESKALCLVVPHMTVAYGKGEVGECPRHPGKKNARTVSFEGETTRFQPVVSVEKERQNRVVSTQKERQKRVVSRSAPSLLISSPNPTTDEPQPERPAS